MNDKHLISYEIFSLRTKFNLENFLKKKLITFEEFADMLRKNSIMPLEREDFDKIKKKVELTNKQENIKNLSKDVKITTSNNEKSKDAVKQTVKRRNRKAKND